MSGFHVRDVNGLLWRFQTRHKKVAVNYLRSQSVLVQRNKTKQIYKYIHARGAKQTEDTFSMASH